MENGGLTAVGVFRKHISANATHSKYTAIIKTREELDIEEAKAAANEKIQAIKDAEQEQIDAINDKQQSLDELTQMTDKLKIGKKTVKPQDAEMREAPKITLQSKGIRKKITCRKSKRQVAF